MANEKETGLKHTPLYDHYTEGNVKLTDFGGWALPLQFTSIIEEHHAVRNKAGLFDVSHMGEVLVQGPNAEDWLNGLLTNDLTKVVVNQAQYNAVCKEDGGILDDLIVFKLSDESYLLTPNAANTEKIIQWLIDHQPEGVDIEDQSEDYGLLALQGPLSEDILSKLTDTDISELKPYRFIPDVTIAGQEGVLLSRTGYTGEDGFELYAKWNQVAPLWEAILKEGDVAKCGLGARDTLRLEAGLGLYGQDLSEEITPLEAGIGFAVKTRKEADFIGKEALMKQREKGLEKVSRGFELNGKGIAREAFPVLNEEGEEIGVVTSGTISPTLEKSIGLMSIDSNYKDIGTTVHIQIRKRTVPATIVKKPFVQKKEKREEK